MAKNSPFEDRNRIKGGDTRLHKGALRIFVSYFTPHIKLFIADLLCAVFMAAVELAFPIFVRYVINVVIEARNFSLFFWLVFGAVAFFLLHSAASYFVAYFGHIFGVLVERDMRKALFAHIQRQSFEFFDTNRTGRLMSRITYDLFEVSELSHHGPEDLLISCLTIVGAVGLMLIIQPMLALWVAICVAIMWFFVAISKARMLSRSQAVKEKTADINASIESSISGIRVTKVFCNEEFERQKFDNSNTEFVKAKGKYYEAMALFHSKIDFCTHIMPVLTLGVGGICIMKGNMAVSDLVAANLFVASFLQPIRRLTNFVEEFSIGISGFNRFCQIMDTHNETLECEHAQNIKNVIGDIEFSNVGFSYRTGGEVLKNVNLKIKHGQKIALVGSSGAGKTTLCSLLPRFYDATCGKITLDGRNIRDFSIESLREKIGIVQQDVFLFAGSIAENIAYGKINASRAEIQKAASAANIETDILQMEAGYDTVVGERGIRLSGGQKQRIAIARVFLKNPPILILDEATSNLDSDTEIKIQTAFNEISKGRTTIVIAHRLSTIRDADIIAVVSGHGITEIGRHEDLLALGGEYAHLYKMQFGIDHV